MSFTFDPREMADDLVALSRVAAKFLSAQSVSRLELLAKDLTNAVANAKKGDHAKFDWKTTAPIQITPSRQWKGGTADFDPMAADISVDYNCTPKANSDRLFAEGVTVIRITDADDRDKIFHFDAEGGGWTEEIDGVRQERAGHPAFHMQFYGIVNDIPRLPSLIVHPVDVISLAILELHQKKWREHITTIQGRSQLRLIPGRQRSRFDTTIDGWRRMINNPDHLAIVAMQSPFLEPLML